MEGNGKKNVEAKSWAIRTCLATDGTRLPFDEKGPAIIGGQPIISISLEEPVGKLERQLMDFQARSAVDKFQYDQINEVSVTGSGIRLAKDTILNKKKHERKKRLFFYLEDD